MLKLENTEVLGWEHAIRGMRNPMNSWEKSDSFWSCSDDPRCDDRCDDCEVKRNSLCVGKGAYQIGPNDLDLMKRLRNAGTDHRKFMRMIAVCVDITAPLYWWKEFDTYKVGTVANSCSTMHKIAAKEFTLEDFSCEHLFNASDVDIYSMNALKMTIDALNTARKKYLETKVKDYWWQMIQLLPSSYNQRRTVMLNYEVLANIYKSRRNHKLDEWHTFCDWIEGLPYSELITERKETLYAENKPVEAADNMTVQTTPTRYVEENGNLIIETKEGVTFRIPRKNVSEEAWKMIQKLEE